MSPEVCRPIRVAVTGHRRIDDRAAVAREVRSSLAHIRRRFAPPGGSADGRAPLEVISPLAEGADRLVAGVALAEGDAALTVPLPRAVEDYAGDFADPASRDEFRRLLARAGRVEALPRCATREREYEQAGRWIVDHCDALLALWDGLPSRGRGGTAEVVRYARGRGVPVYWIRTNRGPVVTREL